MAYGVLLIPWNAVAFELYHSLRFHQQPDLNKYGLRPIRIIYADQIWPRKQAMETPPRHESLKGIANTIRRTPGTTPLVVLDVEHWPLKSTKNVTENLPKYLSLLDSFRAHSPNTRFGFYGTVPIVDFMRASKPGSNKFLQWREESIRLEALASNVDALFPSLYARKNDIDSWLRYAHAHVEVAKAYRPTKPIYLFLMPQFHQSAPEPSDALISGAFWRAQLEFALENADGIVLWGGKNLVTKKPFTWDEQAPWWKETKEFIKRHNLH